MNKKIILIVSLVVLVLVLIGASIFSILKFAKTYLKIGFIFLSTNSITLYNKYNKHSKKMTRNCTFFKKMSFFFAFILSPDSTCIPKFSHIRIMRSTFIYMPNSFFIIKNFYVNNIHFYLKTPKVNICYRYFCQNKHKISIKY